MLKIFSTKYLVPLSFILFSVKKINCDYKELTKYINNS